MFVRAHYHERVSGDTAFIRERDGLVFAAVVDVLGHGEEAHQLAVAIDEFLAAGWSADVVDTMERLHAHLAGSRGAGAGLCVVECDTGLLRYAGIGNTVLRRFGTKELRLASRPGIIGGSTRSPRDERMSLNISDVVLMYTDGVKDRFTLGEYPELLHHSAELISRNVVQRFGKDYDDATCIALRYEK